MVSTIPSPTPEPTEPVEGRGEQDESIAPGAPTDSSAIAQAVDPMLVDIKATEPAGNLELGTGIVVTDSGEVVTNDHVINGAAQVTANDVGNGQTYGAHVVGTDQLQDLAVVQLEGASGLQTAKMGDSDSVYFGEAVVAVGNAHGAGGTPSYAGGAVTALQQHIIEQDEADGWTMALDGVLGTNADLLPGDSGGPLVDPNGDVVGVDTAISEGATGGYAIPIDEALTVTEAIEDEAS
jgi:S1-C subfamily serine protease